MLTTNKIPSTIYTQVRVQPAIDWPPMQTSVEPEILDTGPTRANALRPQVSSSDFQNMYVPKLHPELHSASSMPNLNTYATLGDEDLFSEEFLNDPLPFSLDPFDPLQNFELPTPELDPLSPTYYDLNMQIPELSNSVGSAGSPTRAHPPLAAVEGLSIPDSGKWQTPSPERRAKMAARGVTKQPSRSSLRLRRSRANLNEDPLSQQQMPPAMPQPPVVAPQLMPQPLISPPTQSIQTFSQPVQQPVQTQHSAPPRPAQTSQPQQEQQLLQQPIQNAQPQPHSLQHSTQVRLQPRPQQQQKQSPQWRAQMQRPHAQPTTPAIKHQGRLVSPAMRSPLRPQPNVGGGSLRGMAAAAAAAATGQRAPATPVNGQHDTKASPSTVLLSAKAQGATGVAISPTPAARMHSSSKLVSQASDSSPAKGMWQQQPRAPLSLSELPPPVTSPKRGKPESRRKNPKIIPEMSSSLNQFQVELRPRKSAQNLRSVRPASGGSSTPVIQRPPPFSQLAHRQSMPLLRLDQSDDTDVDLSMLLYDKPNALYDISRSSAMPPLPRALSKNSPGNLSVQEIEHSQVQPQGEPPQHVWASRPQPQKRRQSVKRTVRAPATPQPAASVPQLSQTDDFLSELLDWEWDFA